MTVTAQLKVGSIIRIDTRGGSTAVSSNPSVVSVAKTDEIATIEALQIGNAVVSISVGFVCITFDMTVTNS
jgi:hypothetical protein